MKSPYITRNIEHVYKTKLNCFPENNRCGWVPHFSTVAIHKQTDSQNKRSWYHKASSCPPHLTRMTKKIVTKTRSERRPPNPRDRLSVMVEIHTVQEGKKNQASIMSWAEPERPYLLSHKLLFRPSLSARATGKNPDMKPDCATCPRSVRAGYAVLYNSWRRTTVKTPLLYTP